MSRGLNMYCTLYCMYCTVDLVQMLRRKTTVSKRKIRKFCVPTCATTNIPRGTLRSWPPFHLQIPEDPMRPNSNVVFAIDMQMGCVMSGFSLKYKTQLAVKKKKFTSRLLPPAQEMTTCRKNDVRWRNKSSPKGPYNGWQSPGSSIGTRLTGCRL